MLQKRLRDLREDRDLTQTDVAKLLNISQRTYSGYETGSRMIPYTLLVDLAKYYNTSVDYLVGLTNNPEPYPQK